MDSIDRAKSIIHQVAKNLTQDPEWQERIWEFPEILGVEYLSDYVTRSLRIAEFYFLPLVFIESFLNQRSKRC